jgi:hypothetical protein
MRVAYQQWSPNAATRNVINLANDICAELGAQGFDLTLRQLYYQFVARGHLPNKQQSYKRLGHIVNEARLAGLMDWRYIVDRTRNLQGTSHWETPADVIEAAARSYRIDKWQDQPVRVEVWVEKEALAGIVKRAADLNDVDWFSCRGYVSQSELRSAALRMYGYVQESQRVHILHLGDHDPSGIDMTRDIRERLENFVYTDYARDFAPDLLGDEDEAKDLETLAEYVRTDFDLDAAPITVDRIALNMDQIRRYGPPPNPAKITDSRAKGYIREHGRESWELDALDPQTLAALIAGSIEAVIDPVRYDDLLTRETEERNTLQSIAGHYPAIAETYGGDE